MFKSKLYIVTVIIGVLALAVGACTQPSPLLEDDLEDTKWILQSYGELLNLKEVLTNTNITAEFVSSEGTVKGSTGCNSYFGGYVLEGSQLSIPGPIAITEMYCAEPEGVMDQEREYLLILELSDSFGIDGDGLIIGSGSEVLIYIEER